MPVYDGPLPGATGYAQYQVHANEAYQRALARIQTQRTQLLRSAGYQGTYDSAGKLIDMQVASGPGSEFGGYQTLMGDMASSAEESEATLRARGFSGGGIAQQPLDELQHGYAQATHEFGSDLQSGLGQLGDAEQMATEEYNDGLYQAMLENIRQAAEQGTFNPLDPTGIENPEYGTPETPGLPGLPSSPGAWQPPKPKMLTFAQWSRREPNRKNKTPAQRRANYQKYLRRGVR